MDMGYGIRDMEYGNRLVTQVKNYFCCVFFMCGHYSKIVRDITRFLSLPLFILFVQHQIVGMCSVLAVVVVFVFDLVLLLHKKFHQNSARVRQRWGVIAA